MPPTLMQQFRDYNVSKSTLFWGCVATVILTMGVGFTWGGWTTGGSAIQMADTAARQARAELAATICVNRFLDAADAAAKLETFHKTNSWERTEFIQKGGWVTPPGLELPVPDAANLCAKRLTTAQLPLRDQTSQQGGSASVTQ